MNQYLPVLKNKKFGWLFLSIIITNLASSIANLSLVWVAYHHFKSAWIIALVIAAMQFPGFIIGPFIGGLLDRFNKIRLMIIANLVRSAVFLLLIITPLNNLADLGLFLLLLILSGAMIPLVRGGDAMVIQEIFSSSQRIVANALVTIAFDTAYIMGSLVTGLVLAIGYGVKIYVIVAGLYLCVAVALKMLKLTELTNANQTNVRQAMTGLSTLKVIWRDKDTIVVLLMDFMWNMFLWAGIAVLMPIIVHNIFCDNAEIYGLLEAMTSVGIILGSLLVGRFSKKVSLVHYVIFSIMGHGFLFMLIGLSQDVIFSATLFILIGLVASPALVYKATFYQDVFNQVNRGFLLTFVGSISASIYPTGIALTTLFVSLVGDKNITIILLSYGALVVLMSTFALLSVKRIKLRN
ncbi:MAG: MFS transporter [Lactobacillaceae bacterium]|jgi:MFS family permease|nr:MFS transporter [Lactobacillaceae bacterium]